jgi:hypothetical protein
LLKLSPSFTGRIGWQPLKQQIQIRIQRSTRKNIHELSTQKKASFPASPANLQMQNRAQNLNAVFISAGVNEKSINETSIDSPQKEEDFF